VADRGGSQVAFVVTCEHATAHVPAGWASELAGRRGLLRTHRGFDLGALRAARRIARRLGTTVLAAEVTRLLVDANRSEENRGVFAGTNGVLTTDERERLLERYHRPHRARVVRAVQAGIEARGRVVHVAVHSFTPVLRGQRRPMDVGLLLDPRRPGEDRLAEAWRRALAEREPRLRVARNRPYRGWTDGLATTLRTRFDDPEYAGFELELNQRLVRQTRRLDRLADGLADTLVESIGG
jgi:predicted N-formylglutamate amidohydrolase